VLVDAISLVLDQRAIYKAAGSLIEPAHRETDHSRVRGSSHPRLSRDMRPVTVISIL